jgi:signal transduction histidine kinase/ActR/RegA family two-component response regulator
MANRFSFEIKTSGTTLLILSFVIATGIFTYRNLKEIVDEVTHASQPNTKIALLKQITSDLSDAESSVKSYNLTGDKNYLSPFYAAVTSIDEKIEELQYISAQSPQQKVLIDSIEVLIEEKYTILNNLLSLRKDQEIVNELDRISRQLESTPVKENPDEDDHQEDQESASKKTETKKGIFRKIFGNRENVLHDSGQSKQQSGNLSNPKNIKTLQKDIKHELEKVKEKQSKQFSDTRAEELELTRRDKEVMDQIRALISQIENAERAAIVEKTKKAATRAKQTRTIIAIFCVTASVFLLSLCLTVIGYVRKRRLFERALNEAKIEAERHARAKENFLANMSHEIRTPMNAIAGFTEQLMHSPLNDQQHEQAEIVKKSCDHLLRIINDILDYSKMQAGKMEFEKIGFKPLDIINETFQLVSQLATPKNIELQSVIGKNVPEVVIGDPVRLRQVLLNLVNNSVKFTENGFVKIEVNGRSIDTKSVRLYFKVTDTGIGIPKDKMDVIFNEFEQADTSITRKYGGTGLGLSISKILVELQGGDIYINSTFNKGTEVSFNLPFKKGTENDLIVSQEGPTENIDMQEKKVLVVDDEKFNRKLLCAILKKWNIITEEAENGREALKAINASAYDLLLLDIRMPEMNGIELTQEIRKLGDRNKARMPIIAISAATGVEDIGDYKAAGVDDIISKPFKEEELYTKIKKILRERLKQKQ